MARGAVDKYGHLLPEIHAEAAKRIYTTLFGAGSDNIVRECISNTLAESNQQNNDIGFVAGKQ